MIQRLLRKHGHVRQTSFVLRSGNNERISVWNHRNMVALDEMGLKEVGQDKSRGVVIVSPRRNPNTGTWVIPRVVADLPKVVARNVEGFFKTAAPLRKILLLNLHECFGQSVNQADSQVVRNDSMWPLQGGQAIDLGFQPGDLELTTITHGWQKIEDTILESGWDAFPIGKPASYIVT